MIPKVIHYCWFGENPLPRDVKKYIKSWRNKCPDYVIQQWDESNFDVTVHPFTNAAYRAKAWAFVSDFARLKILYENGGIYLDTDVELLKPLDFLLKYNSFFALQQVGCYCATGLGCGAEKENILVELMMSEYDNLEFDDSRRFDYRCPYLNTKAIMKKGFKQENKLQIIDNNIFLPSQYMDPVSPGGNKSLLCDETISIHHYAALWMPGGYQFKRKIINFIGQKNVNKITRIVKKR